MKVWSGLFELQKDGDFGVVGPPRSRRSLQLLPALKLDREHRRENIASRPRQA